MAESYVEVPYISKNYIFSIVNRFGERMLSGVSDSNHIGYFRKFEHGVEIFCGGMTRVWTVNSKINQDCISTGTLLVFLSSVFHFITGIGQFVHLNSNIVNMIQ